jgi:regulator of sirC expression with transglutaminase-like and TPR domain
MHETHRETTTFRDVPADPHAGVGRMALEVARVNRPELDIAFEIERIDELADEYLDTFTRRSHESLCRFLFADRYIGDVSTYYDPANSMVDQVLDRGIGLPVTLSALAIEVGDRCGLPMVGIGMPSHFVVRHANDPRRYFDPFWGGIELTVQGCRERMEESLPSVAWSPSFLAPITAHQIIDRMLSNLAVCYSNPCSPSDLTWVLELRSALPGSSTGIRRRLADALVGSGRFDDAADVFEELGRDGDADLTGAATRLRARLN